MSFASSRRAKSQTSHTTSRVANLRSRRPALEPMEDRVVLTAAATPHQATVTQLYQDLLHRLPDAGGLAFWTNQLDAGANTGAVAAALTHSGEFHRGEVDGVYQRLLNRAADEGGRAFFASALDNGQSVQQVESAVASSPEYAQAHGGASGFLDALFNGADHLKSLVGGAYQQVLHRAGDAGGLAYWVGRMAAGTSLDDVTASLASSDERAALAAPTATVLGTFADASSLPLSAVGGLETSLAGSVHAALSAGAGALPQAVTKKVGLPAVFQAFGPQRLVDTRNTVNGQYGGPAFVAGGTRTINVAPYNLADPSIPSAAVGDQAPTSNLPANVTAVSVILFIVGAPQPEYFTAYATGTSPPPTATATVFADRTGQIIAASAIVPVNAAGNIDIYSSGGGNLIVDVTGYFLNTLDGTDNLPIIANDPGQAAILGVNNSTSAGSHALGGFVNGTGPVHGVQGQAGASSGSGSSGVHGINDSAGASVYGVLGEIPSTTPGFESAGVRGNSSGTGANGFGVWGSQNGSGVGVRGTVSGAGTGGNFIAGLGGIGVNGIASGDFFNPGLGVQGTASGANSIGGKFSSDSIGVQGVGTFVGGYFSAATGQHRGVVGSVAGVGSIGGDFFGETGVNVNGGSVTGVFASGSTTGVHGTNASTNGAVYGVFGEITSTAPGFESAGVRGNSSGTGANGFGVWGSQNGSGVGVRGTVSGAGTGGDFSAGLGGVGVRGTADARFGSGIGVLGSNNPAGGYSVFAQGNLGATGLKNFVDPNPVDPSKQIAFVSLEGPEAGTYFRGTGHFTNGTATIDVPESFRLVTDPTGLSVQITPLGGTPNFGVQSADLSHVVVAATQDVAFYYLVNGVRKGYAGYDPVQPNRIYVPRAAADTLPTWLTDTQKQTLIGNGTYNADGTVNLATAHALGWDLLWANTTSTGTTAAAK